MECKLVCFLLLMKILFMVESMMYWGRGQGIFCAPVVSWVFYGKQANFFCAAEILEKLWQSVDELYLFELIVD